MKLNGYTVAKKIFDVSEIQIGSQWTASDGSDHVVTIEGINTYGTFDPWFELIYSWEENGEKKTHKKDVFAFQSRYCLILK